MVVTEHLYTAYPDRPEGELAPMRAAVVNAVVLAEVAAELDLGSVVRLGKGEESAGGRTKQSILSDAMEAVIGAVYLDAGWQAAQDLIVPLLTDRITVLDEGGGHRDHKTQLQEIAARRLGAEPPRYEVEATGPDHAKHFHAVVRIGDDEWGSGDGRSKKQAEQAAAAAAVVALAGEADGSAPDPQDDEGMVSTDA